MLFFPQFYQKSVFLFLFFFTVICSFAEQGVQFYEKAEIIQRISWEKEDDVLKYELTIEKKEGDGFIPAFSVSGEETSVEFSLAPGEYRYRVLVYDMLGRLRPIPEWSQLTVFPALQPEIASINPPVLNVSGSDTFIEVRGENLSQNAEVYVTAAETGNESLEYLLSRSSSLDKKSYRIDSSETSIRLELSDIPLEKGFYDIVIRNPGGLSAVWRNYNVVDGTEPVISAGGNRAVKSMAGVETTTGAAYALLIPAQRSLEGFTGQNFLPIGLSARAGVNIWGKYGAFGFELAAYWHDLKGRSDPYTAIIDGHFTNIQMSILYQIRVLDQKLGISAKVGGGISYFFDLQFSEAYSNEYRPNESLKPIGACSLSFSLFLSRRFSIDAAAEYIYIFSTEEMISYIRPLVCFSFHL
jgi:hypothetical protein